MPHPLHPTDHPTPATDRSGPHAAAAALGWDQRWAAALAAEPVTGVPGRVARVDRGACDVLLPGEPLAVRATWSVRVTRAASADPATTPAAGDWVVLVPAATASRRAGWSLEAVLPRRTAVARLQVTPGSSQGQVLAANADVVAVVDGLVPDLDLGRLERLLALAWTSGAQPVVVLTKRDLHPSPDEPVARVVALAGGCDVLAVATPEGEGLDPLRAHLAAGRTLALLGASGVGKSTLLNALVAGDAGDGPMRTQALGAEHKGRHTTVTRELHLAPGGGAVLDTPGLRSVGLRGDEDVDGLFPEVAELAAACRFSDCTHRVEPGCAVLAAVATGDLPARRLEAYRSLEREAAFQARRRDARLRAAELATVKQRQRDYRSRPQRKS